MLEVSTWKPSVQTWEIISSCMLSYLCFFHVTPRLRKDTAAKTADDIALFLKWPKTGAEISSHFLNLHLRNPL